MHFFQLSLMSLPIEADEKQNLCPHCQFEAQDTWELVIS